MIKKLKTLFLGGLPWLIFNLRRSTIDFSKSIVLITAGRGGSTWLMQMLTDDTTIPLFEPFSDLVLSGKFDKPFFAGTPALREQLKEEFEQRFNGKDLPVKSFVSVSIRQAFFGKRMIYKTVNMHFEMPLMLEVFNQVSSQVPLVLTRHPLPVLMSEQNIKGDNSLYSKSDYYWEKLRLSKQHPLQQYLQLTCRNKATFFPRFIELLAKYKLAIEYDDSNVIVLDYEQLRRNPESFIELARREFNINIKQKSIISKSRSHLKNKKQSWESFFKREDVKEFNEILEALEMKDYYSLESETMNSTRFYT